MANTIQFRRGLEADRSSVTPAAGEILYTTDDKLVYIGDGTTAGGNLVSSSGGATIEATASGALANGDMVIVNSDGTVSVVAEQSVSEGNGTKVAFSSARANFEKIAYLGNGKIVVAWQDDPTGYGYSAVGTVSGSSISFGTPVAFTSAQTFQPSLTYDSDNQKVVIVYPDYGNSYATTAVVGTVSGTSISYGSPVVIVSSGASSSPQVDMAYASSEGKVIVAVGFGGNCYLGTVSGTSISFGSAQSFYGGNVGYTSVVWDASNSRIVISYQGLSSYGRSIVGTISGTSISFGSEAIFESATTTYISSAMDIANGKIVIAYVDNGNSNYATAIVGTVSGTSITFGTPSVYNSATTYDQGAAYHAAAGVTTICYRDGGTSSNGYLVNATISGTSLTFTTEYNYTGTDDAYYNAAIYDSVNKQIVIAYMDQGNSLYGTGVTYTPAYTSTNLTSTNFIGVSDGAYADTATATIQTTGAVDDAQTGLTAGSRYYVQTDGTLSTTAGSPSVLAGTALSSTNLLVRG
jgi:hypothetical protein